MAAVQPSSNPLPLSRSFHLHLAPLSSRTRHHLYSKGLWNFWLLTQMGKWEDLGKLRGTTFYPESLNPNLSPSRILSCLQKNLPQVTPNLGYRASLQGQSLCKTPGQAQLTSEDLVNRKQVFHNALLQLVKDQHATFLSSLNPPITVADNRLTAWHR